MRFGAQGKELWLNRRPQEMEVDFALREQGKNPCHSCWSCVLVLNLTKSSQVGRQEWDSLRIGKTSTFSPLWESSGRNSTTKCLLSLTNWSLGMASSFQAPLHCMVPLQLAVPSVSSPLHVAQSIAASSPYLWPTGRPLPLNTYFPHNSCIGILLLNVQVSEEGAIKPREQTNKPNPTTIKHKVPVSCLALTTRVKVDQEAHDRWSRLLSVKALFISDKSL